MIKYCCANRINIGDYLSMLGVQDAVGIAGTDFIMELRKEALLAHLEPLGERDALVVGGGGLLMNYFSGFWREILARQRALGFKLYLFGIGVCDHKNAPASTVINQKILSQIAAQSTLGFYRPPIPEVLATTPPVFCPSILKVKNVYGSRVKQNSRVMLYVSHEALVGKDIDANIITMLKQYCELNGMEYQQVNNVCRNAAELDKTMDLYCAAEVIVSTRLHGYIIGRALGKPVVCISNDEKIEGFACLINDPPPLSLEELSSSAVTERLISASPTDPELIRMAVENIKDCGRQIRESIADI